MIVLLVVVMPIAILLSGALAAALIGGLVKKDVDKTHKESELFELSESNPWSQEKISDYVKYPDEIDQICNRQSLLLSLGSHALLQVLP